MRTTRLALVSPAEDDDVIVRGITLAMAAPAVEESAECYRVGLRNEDGRIYRHVEAEGMRAVIRISECLRRFGFSSEPGTPEPPAHGCQIVFSRPRVSLAGRRHPMVQWHSLQTLRHAGSGS